MPCTDRNRCVCETDLSRRICPSRCRVNDRCGSISAVQRKPAAVHRDAAVHEAEIGHKRSFVNSIVKVRCPSLCNKSTPARFITHLRSFILFNWMPRFLPGISAAGKVEYFLIAPVDGFRDSKSPAPFRPAPINDDRFSLVHDLL